MLCTGSTKRHGVKILYCYISKGQLLAADSHYASWHDIYICSRSTIV